MSLKIIFIGIVILLVLNGLVEWLKGDLDDGDQDDFY